MTQPSKPSRKEKKSEMLDVRLPFGMKQALVKACKNQGVTVSDTVRGLITEYITVAEAGAPQPRLKGIAMKIARNPRKTLGMTLTSALAAVFLLAQPSVADDKLFASFDKNADGIIATDEINEDVVRVLDENHNNSIEPDEFSPLTEVESITDNIRQNDSGADERTVSVVYTKIDLSSPNDASVSILEARETIAADATDSEVEAMVAVLQETVAKSLAEGVFTPPIGTEKN